MSQIILPNIDLKSNRNTSKVNLATIQHARASSMLDNYPTDLMASTGTT